MKRRVFVADMDGTLLDSHTRISPKNMAAIQAHVDKGGLFTVATGRPPASVRMFPGLPELINLPIVSGNGAHIYDLRADKLLRQWLLPPSAEDLCQDVLDAFPDLGAVGYCDLDGYVRFRGGKLVEELSQKEGRQPLPAAPHRHPGKLFKLLFTQERPYLEKLREFLEPKVAGIGRLVFSADVYLELLPLGASKGDALRELLAGQNLSLEETAAIGDAPNDLEMIEAAGLGIAMANAEPIILAHAAAIAPDNDHDGVAWALERFF